MTNLVNVKKLSAIFNEMATVGLIAGKKAGIDHNVQVMAFSESEQILSISASFTTLTLSLLNTPFRAFDVVVSEIAYK